MQQGHKYNPTNCQFGNKPLQLIAGIRLTLTIMYPLAGCATMTLIWPIAHLQHTMWKLYLAVIGRAQGIEKNKLNWTKIFFVVKVFASWTLYNSHIRVPQSGQPAKLPCLSPRLRNLGWLTSNGHSCQDRNLEWQMLHLLNLIAKGRPSSRPIWELTSNISNTM